MFVIVIEFEEGDCVVPGLTERQVQRFYSILRIVFTNVPISVYQIEKIM